MKKKVLLSSIATIALCLCLIAGSTFALFTSKSENNIAVTAAKVEMTADITNWTLASVRPATVAEVRAAADGGDITIIEDEFGGQYVYADREDGTFANGGTADFKDAVLTLDRITPGDKVSFDVVGANTSDVTIQYRYVIECMEGKELMSGLLISVEGITYEFLGSYTSAWATLTPGTDITPVPVVIEFPVTAGNEFQELSTSIKVTVEAVQGNADVEGSKPVIEFLDGISVDLSGRSLPINAGVINTGELELSNGSIAVDEVGFENFGYVTLNNMVIDGGTPGKVAYGYSVLGKGEDSVTVLNDVTINSANGGIGATDGAEVTINGGSVDVSSKNTSGRYNVYAVGEGTLVTINEGNFSFAQSAGWNQKRSYIYAAEGATVIVNGGTFGKASTHKDYKDVPIKGNGTVLVRGGTFGFDPTKWVDEGYKAFKNGTTWYVVPENVDEVVIVTNAAELQNALNNATGDYVIYVNGDINGDVTAVQKADVKVTVNGNGHKFVGALIVDGESSRFETAGLTIKNFNFESDSLTADAYINLGDGTTGTRYTNNVTVQDCTFSYSGAGDKVAVKSYTGGDQNLTLDGLNVNAGMHSMLQVTNVEKGLKITNCKVNAKNGINLNNTPALEMSGCEFDTVGYCVRFGVNGSTNNGTFTIADSTLISANDDGDAVIILRGTMTGATLTLTDTTLTGTPEITGDANIVR